MLLYSEASDSRYPFISRIPPSRVDWFSSSQPLGWSLRYATSQERTSTACRKGAAIHIRPMIMHVGRSIPVGSLSGWKQPYQLPSVGATDVSRASGELAVTANSGTGGLHLLIRTYVIADGDEVITTPFSFFASSNCIRCVRIPMHSTGDSDSMRPPVTISFGREPDALESPLPMLCIVVSERSDEGHFQCSTPSNGT